jgi:hypothetical protein
MADPRCDRCDDQGWYLDSLESRAPLFGRLKMLREPSWVRTVVECGCRDVAGNLARDRYMASRAAA